MLFLASTLHDVHKTNERSVSELSIRLLLHDEKERRKFPTPKNIQYFDTTKKCNVVKELFTITEEDFKSTNYSLDMSDYLEEEETNFEVPMVKLSDICELKNGDQLDKKNIIPGEIPIYGGGKK